MKLTVDLVAARLRAPFVSARASRREVQLLRVSLQDSDGACGHGEAVALEVGVDQLRAALEDCRPLLAEAEDEERERVLEACAQRAVLPQALAAIDLALWDLAGRRAEQPVWRLLGADSAPCVQVNATIASADRAGAAAAAATAREAGFRSLKVKVALGDDAGRLAAVRAAAGAQMAIRLDANGAWSAGEAVSSLRVLEPARIELCEEPASGLREIEAVCAQTPIPIALDESASLPGALERRACHAVCLKIARCGGITGLLRAVARARAVGYRAYLASTLDGPLGIAAALHAAAVAQPDFASGLATLGHFEAADPLPPSSGMLAAPSGSGLGDGLTGWYRH